MKKILLAAASCAAALAVFLIYITLDGGSQRQLNLWYAQDCIPAPVMEELAEEYGSRSGDDSCRIILRSFASEAELAAAGYSAFLIGEAFMAQDEPAKALKSFISQIR